MNVNVDIDVSEFNEWTKKKGERNSKQMYLDLAQQLFNLADTADPSDSGSLDLPED